MAQPVRGYAHAPGGQGCHSSAHTRVSQPSPSLSREPLSMNEELPTSCGAARPRGSLHSHHAGWRIKVDPGVRDVEDADAAVGDGGGAVLPIACESDGKVAGPLANTRHHQTKTPDPFDRTLTGDLSQVRISAPRSQAPGNRHRRCGPAATQLNRRRCSTSLAASLTSSQVTLELGRRGPGRTTRRTSAG